MTAEVARGTHNMGQWRRQRKKLVWIKLEGNRKILLPQSYPNPFWPKNVLSPPHTSLPMSFPRRPQPLVKGGCLLEPLLNTPAPEQLQQTSAPPGLLSPISRTHTFWHISLYSCLHCYEVSSPFLLLVHCLVPQTKVSEKATGTNHGRKKNLGISKSELQKGLKVLIHKAEIWNSCVLMQ